MTAGDTEARDTAWLREHADDPVPVRLLDLMTIVARLAQAQACNGDSMTELLVSRLLDSDLPRLRLLLPAEALAIIEREIS
jgi:hypothetical protein